MRLLKLSLAAYRLQRTVGADGAYSKTVRATRGITAGSGFATTELKLLLHDLVVLLHARWPVALIVKLCVDDLALAACGLPLAACRLPLATCHSLLAACRLPLAGCWLMLATGG